MGRAGTLAAAAFALLAGCSDAAPMDEARDFASKNTYVSETTWGAAARLTCRPDSLEVCGRESCRKIDETPASYVVWEPQGDRYQRCDAKGCDTYTPTVNYSGLFANVVLPEAGNVFRVSSSGEYREIAQLATDTYIYRGRCSTS